MDALKELRPDRLRCGSLPGQGGYQQRYRDQSGQARMESLELESNPRLVGPGLNEMRAAERREKVVHCRLITDVRDRKLQCDPLSIGASQQVIGSDGDVKDVPRRHTGRMVIVVLGSRCRDLHTRCAVHSRNWRIEVLATIG